MWSTAEIFGAPVTEPPGNIAASSSVRPTPSRRRPSTSEIRCLTPASSCSTISWGHRTLPGSHTRERSLRSRSTIITCSAASFSESRARRGRRQRPRSLDRHRPDAPSTAREEQLGRSGDDRPAVADQRARLEWVEGSERDGEPRGVAAKGCGEVLDEIDLVDRPPGDRSPGGLDRTAVPLVRPAALPPSDPEASCRRRLPVRRPDPNRGGRQRARFRRVGRVRAADRPGEGVAEVEVGDEAVRPALEEPGAAQGLLDLRQRANRLHEATLTSWP